MMITTLCVLSNICIVVKCLLSPLFLSRQEKTIVKLIVKYVAIARTSGGNLPLLQGEKPPVCFLADGR